MRLSDLTPRMVRPLGNDMTLPREVVADWRDIIVRLNNLGLSDKEIAERTGYSWTGINALKNESGRDPRYSTGAAILRLLAEVE